MSTCDPLDSYVDRDCVLARDTEREKQIVTGIFCFLLPLLASPAMNEMYVLFSSDLQNLPIDHRQSLSPEVRETRYL